MGKSSEYKIRYLTEEDCKKLDDSPKPERDNVILSILYATGCTVNELIHIKFRDFDLKNNILRIKSENSRNSEPRSVFIPDKTIKLVEEYRQKNKDSEYLLYTRQSSQMTTKRIRQLVQGYCSKVGIKNANPQILRYTHIVHAYMKKIPIDAIQKQVGLKRSRAIEIFGQLQMMDTKDAYRNFT